MKTLLFFLAIGLCVPAVAAEEAALERVHLVTDDFSMWRDDTGEWSVADDAALAPDNAKLLVAKPGAGVYVNGPFGRTQHLISKPEFGDVRAHVEFLVAKESNSGVYFQGRYEIQVLDSWGHEVPEHSDAGGIYQRWDEMRDPKGYEGHPPRENASLPPGEWQTFDVWFRAPRFDADGTKTQNACFLNVMHNGKVVHENVEVTGPTRASLFSDEQPLGPLMLQGDHGPVAYRSIWVEKLPTTDAATASGPDNPFFAMDTALRGDAEMTFEQQAALLAELGYAGMSYGGPLADLPALLAALDAHGLELFALYTPLNIDPDAEPWDPALDAALAQLKGRNTVIWMPATSRTWEKSSVRGDGRAVTLLQMLSPKVADAGLRIALYPHTNDWVETTADAIRVAEKTDRANVGATFNLCHWLRVTGPGDPQPLLAQAMPRLFMVSINGADKDGTDWNTLIQTLDRGTYDVAAFMTTLRGLGYTGPVGFQGYAIGGDQRDNLTRTMAAWRKM